MSRNERHLAIHMGMKVKSGFSMLKPDSIFGHKSVEKVFYRLQRICSLKKMLKEG